MIDIQERGALPAHRIAGRIVLPANDTAEDGAAHDLFELLTDVFGGGTMTDAVHEGRWFGRVSDSQRAGEHVERVRLLWINMAVKRGGTFDHDLFWDILDAAHVIYKRYRRQQRVFEFDALMGFAYYE